MTVPIPRGCEVTLPARLTEVADDIGPGAYLKRMSDDVRAIVVDYVEGKRGAFIVAMVKKKFRKDDMLELTKSPKDYMIEEITETGEWLVLTSGFDVLLIE